MRSYSTALPCPSAWPIRRYFAPELHVAASAECPQSTGTTAGDMFAFGCTLYAVHFGETDFHRLCQSTRPWTAMGRGSLFKSTQISQSMPDLLHKLICKDPGERSLSLSLSLSPSPHPPSHALKQASFLAAWEGREIWATQRE